MKIKAEVVELEAAPEGKVWVTLLVDNEEITGNILYKQAVLSVQMPVKQPSNDGQAKQMAVTGPGSVWAGHLQRDTIYPKDHQ